MEEEQAAAESKPGGGGHLGGGGIGLGGLRELGEQLVAEQEEVEETLLKPNGGDGRSESTMSCRTLCESVASTTSMVDNSTTSMVDDSMLTSCQTLCASSVTDLVDTE